MPVAIVGMACRFPGGVTDPAGFWRLLDRGGDAITRIPPDRFDVEHFFDPAPATPGRIMSAHGGFLDGLREFDAGFFGISPREAERLDPQQRLLLETAWEALEDAGQDVRQLEGSTTGVYVGQWVSDFESRLFADPESVDFLMTTGSGRYASSGRISYALGLRGPSLTLDTACSSSLAAVHLGVRSIRDGESTLALVGGANVILQPHVTIAYSQSRMMAVDGHCKFGDAGGDGYVRSEGAGMVVLKALDRALSDGDRIYALIRGSAINNDGQTSGSLGRPSRLGQEELLRAAYRDAGVSPGLVAYVEAHGTGTRVGDPVELGALNTVLGEGRPAGLPLVVGSVKTNIGHTEAAAGVAGLMKAALALYHGRIPPSLHCREPNPDVEWAALPIRVARAGESWPGGGPCVAGVSSFGIAGSNAHVVLEAAPAPAPAVPASPPRAPAPLLLPLSARSSGALRARAASFAAWLRAPGAPDPVDACHGASRLAGLEHRAVVVAPDASALLAGLDQVASGDAPGAIEGVVDPAARPRVAFVVPGQGGQWAGMARELMQADATFRAAIDACDEALGDLVSWSLAEQLLMEEGDPGWLLGRIDVIQPALVAVAIAYASWWRARGLVPDVIVGHSMGEVGAACLAGVIDLRTAMRLIGRRSALMQRTAGRGAMALLELPMDEMRARLRGLEERVTVAVSNSPRATVISGDPGAVHEVVAAAERDGVFCRMVKVDVASHSPQMEPLAAELAAEFGALQPAGAHTPLYSTVLARRVEGPELGGEYWGWNLRRPVLFAETIRLLVRDGVELFVELGPHPVLKPSLEQVGQAEGRALTVIACGMRDEPGRQALWGALGAAWVAGAGVSPRTLTAGRHVSLPAYPWQRAYHWVEAAEVRSADRPRLRTTLDDRMGSWLYCQRWAGFAPGEVTGTGRHCVVVGHADWSREVAAAAASQGASAQVANLASLPGALGAHDATGVRPDTIIVLVEEDASPWLAVQVAQAVLGQEFPVPPRTWFVTRGAHAVDDRDAGHVNVAHAALWGAALVVGEEHPELWGGLVDADPTIPVSGEPTVRAVLAAGEDQVALRRGAFWARRLAPMNFGSVAEPALDGTWLVTGGLGEVGLHLARGLASAGVRRMVLMGRSSLPARSEWGAALQEPRVARRVAAVRELEAAGVAVHLTELDVSRPGALEGFLRRHAAEAWPAIRGVVHAAGTLNNQLVGSMTRPTFDDVIASKLGAAAELDRLLPDLDAFVLVSSTGAFLPQPGQANYAAANAGLDALVERRRARGQRALSINWAVWEGTGLVRSESGEQGVAEMRRHGIDPFTPAEGRAIFETLLLGAAGPVAVIPADWSVWRGARPGRSCTIARELLPDAPMDAGLGGPVAHPTAVSQRARVERAVREAVGHVLKVAPGRIDPRRTLGGMGLNSLMAMELRSRLEAALARPLSATLAWNYPTVDALVAFLASDEGQDRAATPAPTAAPGVPDLEGLSDEAALRALRTRMPGPRS